MLPPLAVVLLKLAGLIRFCVRRRQGGGIEIALVTLETIMGRCCLAKVFTKTVLNTLHHK